MTALYAQPQRCVCAPAYRYKGIKVTIGGIKYNSIKELAEAYGLPAATVYSRLHSKGMSPEEAVSFGKVNAVTCYGKTYPSKAALAREYGMIQGTLVHRLIMGMTPEHAVSKPVSHLDFIGEGKIYLITNKSTGKQYIGQTVLTLESRLKNHLREAKSGSGSAGGLKDAMRNFPEEDFTIEELRSSIKCRKDLDNLEDEFIKQYNTLIPNGYNLRTAHPFGGGQRGQEITVFGKTFSSHNEMCRFHKLKSSTVRNRIKKRWSLEEALTKPIATSSGLTVEAFGKTFKSIKACSRHFKISGSLLGERLAKKQPAEEAIKDLQEGRCTLPTVHEIVVFGKKYKGKEDVCKAHNHCVSTINYRMKKHGSTLEEALLIPRTKNKFELKQHIKDMNIKKNEDTPNVS